jgi:hypothetical protein
MLMAVTKVFFFLTLSELNFKTMKVEDSNSCFCHLSVKPWQPLKKRLSVVTPKTRSTNTIIVRSPPGAKTTAWTP